MTSIICLTCKKKVITSSNRQLYCKKCGKKHEKEYQKKYQEKKRKHINEKMYEWKKANPEKFEINQKKYRENNKEKEKLRCQKYKKSYRGKQIQLKINLNRSARLNTIKHVFTIDEWKQQVENTKGVCPMCGKYVGIEKLTLDHIIPISKSKIGQIYTIDAVQPLCKSCNSKKNNKI